MIQFLYLVSQELDQHLLNKFLASHSMIDGTLELPNILSLAHSLRGDDVYGKKGKYPRVIEELSLEQRYKRLEITYINETAIHRKSAPLFTDKMPNNFRHIALIHLILPNAKIIDARRYPLIVVLACLNSFLLKAKNLHMALKKQQIITIVMSN
jgi:hypothetical protein